MSRPPKPLLPQLEGISASAVACPAGAWPTALDFLAERLPRVSREAWGARMQRGEVLDEHGRALAADAPFRAHTRLYYYRRLDHEDPIPFEERILFRDEFLLVADKPHFLPVTPKGRYVQQTLLTRLKRRSGLETLTPIHRIDRETAGLVLFSIQPATRDAYQALFRERAVGKAYEAIARFDPGLCLRLPLCYRSRLQQRDDAFMQMQEVPGEPNAETEIRLLEQHGEFARYALHPSTGQKHQLRAQMSALGLPLVGDRIYPRLLPEEPRPDYSAPLQLLARAIEFTDPCTGRRRFYESARALSFPD